MLTDDEQEKIVNHYAKRFEVKQKEMVYIPEETKNDYKVDLFWIKPRKNHRFHTLATMGLSDYHMSGGSNEYIELIMVMPENWRITDDNGEHVWQVQFLRNMAHEIQKNKLHIEYGDLLVTANADETIDPKTNMYCGLVIFPEVYSPKIFRLNQVKGKTVKFYALTTLTKSEFDKANSKDICDFIDEDFSTEDGTEIFVLEQRAAKRAPKKLLSEKKVENTTPLKTKTEQKTTTDKKKSDKVIIKNKK